MGPLDVQCLMPAKQQGLLESCDITSSGLGVTVYMLGVMVLCLSWVASCVVF